MVTETAVTVTEVLCSTTKDTENEVTKEGKGGVLYK